MRLDATCHIPPIVVWYSRDSLCYGVGARVAYITAKCKKKMRDGAWRGRGALGRIPGSLEGAPPGADAGGNQGKQVTEYSIHT